ncbi:MAG: DUF4398 domain-containing protein [Desulfobacterales bacterium]|nr:DUF4398 domain-containing protein [Desulfobacterales bacterium]
MSLFGSGFLLIWLKDIRAAFIPGCRGLRYNYNLKKRYGHCLHSQKTVFGIIANRRHNVSKGVMTMHNMIKRRGGLYGLLCFPFFLILVGCGGANSDALQRDIARAEMAINEAREADASEYAPLELKLARDNLQNARKAFAGKGYDEARRFVEKALMDAKLAEAKARTEKTKQTAQQLRENIETLEQELFNK